MILQRQMKGSSSSSFQKKTLKIKQMRRRKQLGMTTSLKMLATLAIMILGLNICSLHVTQSYNATNRFPATATDVEHIPEADHNQPQRNAIVTLESLVDLDPAFIQQKLTQTDNSKSVSTMNAHSNTSDWIEASRGKEQFLNLLSDAGIQIPDVRVIQLLPTLHQVEQLYGKNGPRTVGLSQCDSFHRKESQDTAGSQRRALGIAGMFNSGTNLAAEYLKSNCILAPANYPDDNNCNNNSSSSSSTNTRTMDILWEVPWGKHVVADMRKIHHPQKEENNRFVHSNHGTDTSWNYANVMPIVMIRDPFFWMQSQCHHNYGAQWLHTSDHCPNLVPNQVDFKLYHFPKGTIPVRIKYDFGLRKWDSLVHLWTLWYQQYFKDADYPRLLVRFEDFVFYPKQVTEQICACAGGTTREGKDFQYQMESAKTGPGHGKARNSWVSAMIRYGSPGPHRLKGFTEQDLRLADKTLDLDLMQTLSYQPSSCC